MTETFENEKQEKNRNEKQSEKQRKKNGEKKWRKRNKTEKEKKTHGFTFFSFLFLFSLLFSNLDNLGLDWVLFLFFFPNLGFVIFLNIFKVHLMFLSDSIVL